jgi:N-formylglutamate amidohydrolase
MDSRVLADTDAPGALEILAPGEQRLPVVLASPHSGRTYPDAFVAASQLDPVALRRSEDGFVDEIFAGAPLHGAPLLKALFPRAFLDPNREAFELDPEMFADPLPAYVNTRSPRVIAGLGTIARIVGHGQEIYRCKLDFAEALWRINRLYRPYHRALADLIEATRLRFGLCILIDCHSMPSSGDAAGDQAGGSPADFVLGDCYGSACHAAVVETAEAWLEERGYAVVRNAPYAGGYTTRHYGRPRAGVHALQIEINRSLYMDERRLTRKPYLATLANEMPLLIEALGRIDVTALRAA